MRRRLLLQLYRRKKRKLLQLQKRRVRKLLLLLRKNLRSCQKLGRLPIHQNKCKWLKMGLGLLLLLLKRSCVQLIMVFCLYCVSPDHCKPI